MRAPLYFYVSQYHRETRPFAVPVHLVGGQIEGGSGWITVRGLAGRRAGQTFTIDRNELYRTPGNARLVAGGREAIARYGLPELDEVAAVRRLRKRIGTRALTERQLSRAIEEARQLAARVRTKTPHDRAWVYFDKDLNDWDARGDERGDGGARAVGMLGMILGAAERYTPPPVDVGSPAYARAVALEREANELGYNITMAGEAPGRWLEVADAFEVAEDAWREAGDDARADNVRAQRQNIVTTIQRAYAPRRQR